MNLYSPGVLESWSTSKLASHYMTLFRLPSCPYTYLEEVASFLSERPTADLLGIYDAMCMRLCIAIDREHYEDAALFRDMKRDFVSYVIFDIMSGTGQQEDSPINV